MNIEANYSYSHEIDDLVNVFQGWSNPFNANADRSSGDWDVRQNLTGSIVYDLAELKDRNAWLRTAAGGWQVSSIVQTRSGLPTNISLVSGFFGDPMRPDPVAGQAKYVSNRSWPTRSFNSAAYAVPPGYNGTWGNDPGAVGRNDLRGPAFFQWDFSGMKNFGITEKTRLQFRADLFNLLNHPNFANPDGGVCLAVSAATATTAAGCLPNGNFGRAAQTVAGASGGAIGNGTSRQAQLSLKLIF